MDRSLTFSSALLFVALLGAPLSTACTVREEAVEYPDGEAEEEYEVEPPVAKVEVQPVRPTRGHVWIAGHWRRAHNEWIWIGGRWEAPRRGHIWVEGHWARRGLHYRWIPGHWQR